MKNKLSAFLLTLCLALSVTPITLQPIQAAMTVKVGDYMQFGSYHGAPILWRVINLDADGDPLLFSEKILCLKAYDASGNYHTDLELNGCEVDNRRVYGSNYWPDSNIRQWLNSSQANIDWIQNDPSAANLLPSYNPYNTEAGFLSEKNFTLTEKTAIKPVTHKVLLAEIDKDKKDGGTQAHQFTYEMEDIIQNYNQVFYKNVTDTMFYLDVKQLKEYVYDRGWEVRAKPTAEALSNSIYSHIFLSTNEYWYYSLSSPSAAYADSIDVRGVDGDGSVNFTYASYCGAGVRPACYINLNSVIFTSGTGTKASPYIVKAIDVSSNPPTEIMATPTASQILVDGKEITFDAYTINGNNYFKLRDLAKVFSGSTKQFNVTWDNAKKAINLISNQSYTVVGGEMALGEGKNKSGTLNSSKIYLDGKEITLTAYTINGNNYFKLRDIGQVFNIGVTWDGVNKTIVVETTKGYQESSIEIENNEFIFDVDSLKLINNYQETPLGMSFSDVSVFLNDLNISYIVDEEKNDKFTINSYQKIRSDNGIVYYFDSGKLFGIAIIKDSLDPLESFDAHIVEGNIYSHFEVFGKPDKIYVDRASGTHISEYYDGVNYLMLYYNLEGYLADWTLLNRSIGLVETGIQEAEELIIWDKQYSKEMFGEF